MFLHVLIRICNYKHTYHIQYGFCHLSAFFIYLYFLKFKVLILLITYKSNRVFANFLRSYLHHSHFLLLPDVEVNERAFQFQLRKQFDFLSIFTT